MSPLNSRRLKLRVQDFDQNEIHRVLGEVETNLVKMQECAGGQFMECCMQGNCKATCKGGVRVHARYLGS